MHPDRPARHGWPVVRECSGTGYRAPVFYGNLWEKTVSHACLQEYCFVLREINLRKPPGVYR